MRSVTLRVVGTPAPQGSKNVGRYGQVYESSKALPQWRAAVLAEALRVRRHTLPFDGPLSLTVDFYLPRPVGHYGTGRNAGRLKPSAPSTCHVKPDLDKLVRAVGDAITQAGLWTEDSRVIELAANKHYAIRQPGATLTITETEPKP